MVILDAKFRVGQVRLPKIRSDRVSARRRARPRYGAVQALGRTVAWNRAEARSRPSTSLSGKAAFRT